MKNKFEISIIAFIGLLVISILYFIFNDVEQTAAFKYESIEYEDLVSRNAKLGLYAVPENYENPICFSIPNNNKIDSQVFLSGYIDEISHILEDVQFADTPPEFHTRFDTQIKTSLALEMIDLYDFVPTVIQTDNNVGKIADRLYHFDCPFEYEDEQMMLRIMFESHFWESMPVYVDVTRNDIGVPTLTNDNVVVFDGGINSTVLFQNDLEKEITIRATDPINYLRDYNDRYYDLQEPKKLFENRFAKISNEDKITIPPGKAFSYHFSSWSNPHSTPLNYTITPLNLKGTITVIPYFDCAPQKEIFSAYSKYHKIPESPSFIPAGYSYECGFYHYPEAATFYYANSTQSKEFGEKLGHGINPEFLAAGGLAIQIVDVKSYGTPYIETESDKFTRLVERLSSDSMVTFLNGQPTVLEKKNYGQPLNRITIYLDYDTWYVVEGGIPFLELYKIAQSIPFERGDSSVPSVFETPFKEKPLTIELIDMNEIYQPGNPIHFEIFTHGHIPVSSQIAITIQESNEEDIVWQNIPLVNVGDPEIGFVDYTWSTEYDLGVPQIYKTGEYEMIVSWNDITAHHKFQIREEAQFTFLKDMIPEHADDEDFLLSFENDCSRKAINQILLTGDTERKIQIIQEKLKENDQLLDLLFEKQEEMTNDQTRTFSYDVPKDVIQCIKNIKNNGMSLAEDLASHGQKPELNMQLLLREAEILFDGHESRLAIKTADFIIENIESNNPDALVVKGKSLARLSQYEEAIQTFKKAVEANPDLVKGWYHMGRTLSADDQHEKALQSFDQAIKIDSKFADAYIGKAFTLMTLERFDEALENAEKAIQVKPDIPIYRNIYQTILDVSESQ